MVLKNIGLGRDFQIKILLKEAYFFTMNVKWGKS